MKQDIVNRQNRPGPGFLGQAFLSQSSCDDLGVSLRRCLLQFNIRPWRISALGNPLLRLGLPRSIRQSRVAGGAWALAEKEPGVSPNGLGYGRRMGCERAMSTQPAITP